MATTSSFKVAGIINILLQFHDLRVLNNIVSISYNIVLILYLYPHAAPQSEAPQQAALQTIGVICQAFFQVCYNGPCMCDICVHPLHLKK